MSHQVEFEQVRFSEYMARQNGVLPGGGRLLLTSGTR